MNSICIAMRMAASALSGVEYNSYVLILGIATIYVCLFFQECFTLHKNDGQLKLRWLTVNLTLVQ